MPDSDSIGGVNSQNSRAVGAVWLDGWRLALGTLTIIPTKPPRLVDAKRAGIAMSLAPLAILPVAVVITLILVVLRYFNFPELLLGFMGITLLQIGTRAMHADGLADTVDAFGASWDRDRALRVMKSGDIGPMGALALIAAFTLQSMALSGFLGSPWRLVLFGLAVVLSRQFLAWLCLPIFSAARSTGLGAMVAGSTSFFAAALGAILGFSLAFSVIGFWAGFLVIPYLFTWLVVYFLQKRFAGITGDVLGAGVEIFFTIALLSLAAIPIK